MTPQELYHNAMEAFQAGKCKPIRICLAIFEKGEQCACGLGAAFTNKYSFEEVIQKGINVDVDYLSEGSHLPFLYAKFANGFDGNYFGITYGVDEEIKKLGLEYYEIGQKLWEDLH